jgi:predicted nucleic acid-binding protein
MAMMEPGKEKMPGEFHVLVDSDAFVGRFYTKDAHHQRVLEIFARHEKKGSVLVTTNMVIGETATILSHREGQPLARKFLDIISQSLMNTIHIDETLHEEATKIFLAQQARGTSMTDCANVAVMQRFNIAQILSFDKFYFNKCGLESA